MKTNMEEANKYFNSISQMEFQYLFGVENFRRALHILEEWVEDVHTIDKKASAKKANSIDTFTEHAHNFQTTVETMCHKSNFKTVIEFVGKQQCALTIYSNMYDIYLDLTEDNPSSKKLDNIRKIPKLLGEQSGLYIFFENHRSPIALLMIAAILILGCIYEFYLLDSNLRFLFSIIAFAIIIVVAVNLYKNRANLQYQFRKDEANRIRNRSTYFAKRHTQETLNMIFSLKDFFKW